MKKSILSVFLFYTIERSTLESSEQSSSASFLLPFTSGWTYTRILSRVTEYLEKKKRHKDANDILELLLSQNSFCTGSRGRWADRLALNYDHHLKKKSEVHQLSNNCYRVWYKCLLISSLFHQNCAKYLKEIDIAILLLLYFHVLSQVPGSGHASFKGSIHP